MPSKGVYVPVRPAVNPRVNGLLVYLHFLVRYELYIQQIPTVFIQLQQSDSIRYNIIHLST